LRLRLRMSSYCGLFPRLGHGDGPVLHDLNAITIRFIRGLFIGVFLIELESISPEGVHFDFTACRKISTVDH
jgi:hypothetical protein